MSIKLTFFALFINISLSPLAAVADQKQGAETVSETVKPKVGLVLSGGGARGGAHIGVLKALEAMNISVDMIAGTSMGAVIGGLYASGYGATEIETIIRNIDWHEIFDDETNRENRQYRHKRVKDDRFMDFRLGFKDGEIIFPKGLLKGQKLILELKKLTYPVQKIRNFDHLPIPFRAVATDIETGKAVVLKDGDLGLSLFASMAIPALLPPVEMTGRLLVDGGVSNNLPIDVIKEMGADFIIVVDVGTQLLKKTEIESVLSVTDQLVRLIGRNNSLQQLAELRQSGTKHVVIRPDLDTISTADFLRIAETIAKGQAATQAHRQELSAYATSFDAGPVMVRTSPVIDFVRIDNKTKLSDDVILKHLNIQTGVALSPEELNQRIAQVYALGAFERISYDLVQDGEETGLMIKALPNSIGKTHIRFGLILSDNLKGDSSYSLLTSLSVTEMNDLGAELRFDMEIGENLLLGAEYYQPLNITSNLFVSGNIAANVVNRNIYGAPQVPEEFRVASIDVSGFGGILLGTWGEARFGLSRNWVKIRENDGEFSFFGGDKFISTNWTAQLNADTLDRIHFPRKGLRLNLTYQGARRFLGGENEYNLIAGTARYVLSRGRSTLDFNLRGGATFNRTGLVPSAFTLGGFQSLSGINRDRLLGAFMGFGAVRYHYQLTKSQLNIIDLPLYVGASLEAGNTWDRKNDVGFDRLIYAGSIFVAVETPLGPVYFGLGLTDNDNQSLYFSLGQSF